MHFSDAMKVVVFFVLLLLGCPDLLAAWKKEEFRDCNRTPFCKRARARKPGSCSLFATDISITDGDLTATLVHRSPEFSADDLRPTNNTDHQGNNSLSIIISVYQEGILRLKVDEVNSLKKRFEVPYVLLPQFLNKKIRLQNVSTIHIDGGTGLSSVVDLSDCCEAVIRHDPFEVYVRERSGPRIISLNSHGLFDFELLKTKNEGDNWEEIFRGHTDTRPYGSQSISFDVSFHGSSHVYGIPEHATSLALKPTRGPGIEDSEPYRLFNLDVFEYLHESPFGLYGSIPFMLAHGKMKGTSGFFWLNAAEMQIDVLEHGWDGVSESHKRVDTHWMSEAGIVDVFFFTGPGPKDVLRKYTGITGTPSMPQLFSVGYHQCRWNYRDAEDVRNVDSKFDEHDIPYDVLWLDIEHTDNKKYFTWDKLMFPDPEGMQKGLWSKGRRMVTIVDPHMKRDDSFSLHREASEKGYYVKDAGGKDFDGWCWSGSSSYPDVLDPEIRSWWADKFSLTNYAGSTGSLYIWNDMNEPSVFNGPEITMPRDALHLGGVEHREMHNAYGYYFHMATTEGLLRRGDMDDRPFVLSRSFFSGTQRQSAVWTGDNTADWDHLRASVPMILTLGLTGLAFSGADVPGFFGNPEDELLVRWYQLGSYYPFFRAHAHHDTRRREPWLFGDRITGLVRDAIRVRYSLLPFYYTLFREANTTGIPVMRPLWMEFPDDNATFADDGSFMIGAGLLVHGIYRPKQKREPVYLPGGKHTWYDWGTGAAYGGGALHEMEVSDDSIPSFQRSGTIIPRKDRARRSTTQMSDDPLTLVVALDASQFAEGELYIDDGRSFQFMYGSYIHRRFTFSDGELRSVSLSPAVCRQPNFSSDCVVERIILLGCSLKTERAVVEPSGLIVVVESGPLWLHRLDSPSFLTVRKPGVRVRDDWTIRLL